MAELYRPTTRAELYAERWTHFDTYQPTPDAHVYLIIESEHGWYRYELWDNGQVQSYGTGRWEELEMLKNHLHAEDAMRREGMRS